MKYVYHFQSKAAANKLLLLSQEGKFHNPPGIIWQAKTNLAGMGS